MKNRQNWRGHALRHGRFSDTNQVYLITTVTQHRAPFFSDFQAGRIVAKTLKYQSDIAETWAFVIMPDHLHWLVQLKSGTVSELVRKVKGGSSFHINRYLERKGPLWQSGFYDTAIRDENHAIESARYIVANPLRAGLVKSVGKYPLWDAIWI